MSNRAIESGYAGMPAGDAGATSMDADGNSVE
jgi:hypothetical protein